MIGRKAPSRLETAVRLGVAALVLLTAAFSRKASAQEIRIERVGVSAPMGGAAAAAPSGAMLSGSGFLSGAAPSLLAPSINLGAAGTSALVPSAVPAAQAISAHPAPSANAAPTPVKSISHTGSAAAASPVPSAATTEQEPARRSGSGSTVDTRSRTASIAAPRSASALQAVPVLAAAADGPRSSEMDRDGAQREFSDLLGERLIAGKGETSANSAVAARPTSAAPRLAPATRRDARFLAAVPAVLALGLHPSVRAFLHPSLATWHVMSQAGYVAGNVGAAIFPLVQIYETFHGKSTPKWRAIIGAAASLALGLICAPILHKSLWGVQNIFGGLTLLVPLLLGALKGRVKGNGLKETALIAAAAVAVSVAAYFAVAATLPGVLAAVLSAAAIAKIALVVQFATSAMFLWMFLPDVVKVLRGKAAGGFSSGFNLMFLLSALGSMLWAVPSAWIYSGADQNTYRLIFAVNAIYALASFLSFWFARRESKPA